MGGGSWSASTYASTTRSKIDSGTSFAYSSTTKRSKDRDQWKAHEDLDPKKVAGAASPLAGKIVRESRDNPDHPLSTPIAVWFDETGSMGSVPKVLQEKLAGLFGLLLRKAYADDPQILSGAYGDAVCDKVPLQVSQFESDNRIDDALDNLFLEGNGGGNLGESMDMAWYYMAYHTATDAWDKRGKKGYAFFIGDEIAHGLRSDYIRQYIVGPDGDVQEDLSHESVVRDLTEKWDAYVLVINNSAAAGQGSIDFYRKLFGERVLIVDDPASIAETIALTIGMLEGTIDLEDGVDDLKELGGSDSAVKSASKAVETLAKGGRKLGQVVVGDAPADLDDETADSGSARL